MTEKFILKKANYTDGNLAVMLDYFDNDFKCFMPYARLTVNLDVKLPSNQAFVDVNNLSKEIIDYIVKEGYMEPVIVNGEAVTRVSGFVTYPLYQFELDKIEDAM